MIYLFSWLRRGVPVVITGCLLSASCVRLPQGLGHYGDNAETINSVLAGPHYGLSLEDRVRESVRSAGEEKIKENTWIFEEVVDEMDEERCFRLVLRLSVCSNGRDLLGVIVCPDAGPRSNFPTSVKAQGEFQICGYELVHSPKTAFTVQCITIRYQVEFERYEHGGLWPFSKWDLKRSGQGELAVQVCGDGRIRELGKDTMGSMKVRKGMIMAHGK